MKSGGIIINILVIDVGTSSMRGILYNSQGREVLSERVNTVPKYLPNNWVEQDPLVWRNGLIKIIKNIVERSDGIAIKVDALSITSQRSSIIPVDRHGNHLCKAIMWQDKRADELCSAMDDKLSYVYNLTGLRITSIYTAPKIQWLKINRPEVYENSYKIITICDYITYQLINEFITDYSIASRSLLFNINSMKWDKNLLELFNIEEQKLCSIVEQGSIGGYTTSNIAKITGISTGIPVIMAGGDQQCAALGLQVIKEGEAEVNTGSGAFLVACSDKPIFDKAMRVNCNVSAIPGKWIIEASMFTAGSIYRWFNRHFYNDNDDFEEINYEVSKVEPGCNGLTLIPHFKGAGSPYWNTMSKGSFLNVGLDTTRKEFARAILESIACEIAENINIIEEFVGNIDSVSVAGGATQINIYNQMQADIYEKDIVWHKNKEATAKGAWISAAKTLGVFSSYEEACEFINKNYESKVFKANKENVEIYRGVKYRKKHLYRLLNS